MYVFLMGEGGSGESECRRSAVDAGTTLNGATHGTI